MQYLLIKVYNSRTFCKFLSILSHIVSLACVAMFLACLGYFTYLESYLSAAKISVCLLVGYIFVTGLRDIVDAPRPYELYDFYEVKPKNRKGKSFPSRHAYSAFAIAVAAFSVHVALGALFVLLAASMCAARVLLGIHFIRDVAAGSLIGVIAGICALMCIA